MQRLTAGRHLSGPTMRLLHDLTAERVPDGPSMSVLQGRHSTPPPVRRGPAQQADIQAFLLWQTGKLKLKD